MARIVINPTTFKNKKDALCVAFDEGFRILMEMSAFEPVSEPTAEQRKFFADTEYADDEVQLRRTILARVCTLDTSVPRPTDSQIQEAVEFLESVLEMGACQNEWEQASVRKLLDMMKAIPVRGGGAKKPSNGGTEGDVGGGTAATSPTNEEEMQKANAQANEAPQPTPEPEKPQETAPTAEQVGAAVQAPDGGTVFVPGGINGENAAAVSEAMNAKTQTDYKDGNVWRDKNGQKIGDDSQYKQYQEAQKALAGTGAYYDNGTFRTKDGAAIGSDLNSVNQFAKISKETAGTGAYYDAGTWRTKTGAKLDISQWAPKPAAQTQATPQQAAKPQETKPQETKPQSDAGRLTAGIDRSQFGQNGRIGVPARDPVTGRSRLSMNGPAIKPARKIGDMGARTLTNTRSMARPAANPQKPAAPVASTGTSTKVETSWKRKKTASRMSAI